MSDYKVGQTIKLIRPDDGDIEYGFSENQTFTISKVDNLYIWVSSSFAFQRGQIELVNADSEYKNSNRYKLNKAASETGFSFSKLSRAMGRSDTYISNESKESRFNSRGDLTDKRYNQLIIDLAYAERTLNGNPAKVVDVETESLCIEKPLELVEKDAVPSFKTKQKIKSKTEVNKSIVWFILFILVVVILVLVAGIYKSIF